MCQNFTLWHEHFLANFLCTIPGGTTHIAACVVKGDVHCAACAAIGGGPVFTSGTIAEVDWYKYDKLRYLKRMINIPK